MLAHQRRQGIVALLQEEGCAKVSDLSKIFSVTEPTIRQDLTILAKEGLLQRDHGGAFITSVASQVKSLQLSRLQNMDKKEQIAKKAISLIGPSDSLILDCGTTVTEIAKLLQNRENLTVVTNALNIALLLGANHTNNIMMTGGEFKAPTLSLTGEKAAAFFDSIHLDILFLACGGISREGMITYPGMLDLQVKKAMIASAQRTIMVTDSSKFGSTAFASLGSIDQVDTIITDEEVPGWAIQLCKERDIELLF